MTTSFRPATPADQLDITALVRSERLNPIGVHWSSFTVAVGEDGYVVGAVQLRRHADGSRELGSFVVASRARGCGIGTRLIDGLLRCNASPVHMITASRYASHYGRWGFRPIKPQQAPRAVRLNYRLGRLARVISLFRRQRFNDLVILECPGSPVGPDAAVHPVRVRRRAGVMA